MSERWRPVSGYHDLYVVSDAGRVKRLVARHTRPANEFLKRPLDKDGYRKVHLSKNRTQKLFSVHRLVLTAFIGPCPAGMECNHKNGVRGDNHLTNLEWCTSSANLQHAYDHLNRKGPQRERQGNVKLTAEIIQDIRSSVARGVPQRYLAHLYKVTQPTISKIVSRKSWAHIP